MPRYGERDRCPRASGPIARSTIATAHSGQPSLPAEGHAREQRRQAICCRFAIGQESYRLVRADAVMRKKRQHQIGGHVPECVNVSEAVPATVVAQ